MCLLITLALLIKLGAAPFHQWRPSAAEGLHWGPLFIMLRVQKLIPLILVAIAHKERYKGLLYLFIFSSAAVGSLGGISHTSLRKVIVYSSIRHLAWILASYHLSATTWLTYFFFYSLILGSIVINLHLLQAFSLNQLAIKNKLRTNLILARSLLSLGGLPPFTGFIPKLVVTQQMMRSPHSFLVVPLLLRTLISLFFYARILVSIFLTSDFSRPSIRPGKSLASSSINLVGLLGPSIFFFLNFKLIKLRAFKALNKPVLSLIRLKLIKLKVFQTLIKPGLVLNSCPMTFLH